MDSIFDEQVYNKMMDRILGIQESNPRQWGKMDVGQMLSHVNYAVDMAHGDVKSKGKAGFFMRYIVKPFVLIKKPFSKNLPTAPDFIVTSSKDFNKEKLRLIENLKRTRSKGSNGEWHPHVAFGPLKPNEWGILIFKHLDHHLRQFSA